MKMVLVRDGPDKPFVDVAMSLVTGNSTVMTDIDNSVTIAINCADPKPVAVGVGYVQEVFEGTLARWGSIERVTATAIVIVMLLAPAFPITAFRASVYCTESRFWLWLKGSLFPASDITSMTEATSLNVSITSCYGTDFWGHNSNISM
jgi:hypothetical protein